MNSDYFTAYSIDGYITTDICYYIVNDKITD